MDPAGAFLEAIVETPDDLGPRLVFADWLEDHGDSDRAEFIRLQIARSQLHPADVRVRPMLRREAELLQQHERSWLGPLARLAQRCRFHRGFVEEVVIGLSQFLLEGEELLRLAPVRHLHLRQGNDLPTLLQNNAATAHRLAQLLRPIRVLNLNYSYLSEAAGLALLNLPELPQLEGLHLTRNALSVPGVGILAQSPALTSLRLLEFNPSSPSREILEVLFQSPHLHNLQELSLNGVSQGDRVAALLAGSPLLPRLRCLSLCHSGLTADGLASLIHHPRANHLESLELSFNPLTSIGVRELARGRYLNNLAWVNLSRCNVGNDGVALLAKSDLFSQLIGVDLSLNRVSDEGALALIHAPKEASLGTLDLIYNPLGAGAREALRQRFGPEVCLFQR